MSHLACIYCGEPAIEPWIACCGEVHFEEVQDEEDQDEEEQDGEQS